MVAPLRPILRLTDGGLVTQLYRMIGGAPAPLVRRAFKLSSGTKMFTKPLAMLQHLDDSEWLAQIEAVDRFTSHMHAYPGRSFGQLYHRMLKANQLLTGKVDLSGHEIDVADIKAPVLVFAGNTDGIAPINAVQALVPLLTRRPRGPVRDRARRAPRHAHRPRRADHHLGDDGRVDRAVLHPRRPGCHQVAQEDRQEAPRRRSPPQPRKKPTPRVPKPAAEVAPDRSAIGSNPERRFASASSRNLARKP